MGCRSAASAVDHESHEKDRKQCDRGILVHIVRPTVYIAPPQRLRYYGFMSEFISSLESRAVKGGQERILFVENDASVIAAAQHLREAGLAKPIMVHRPGEDTSAMTLGGLTQVTIEPAHAAALEAMLVAGGKGKISEADAKELANDPLVYGMYLLKIGEADGIVAGKERKTSDVIRAGLRVVGVKDDVETISSSFYMVVPPFRGGDKEEVLTFADCGIVKHPTPQQLADIVVAAADAREFVVGDEPHVALLSFSTKGSGGHSPSVDLIQQALPLIRAKRPLLKVEGELQADAALIEAVSVRKIGKESAIGHGKANVLVFPSLDAGNIAYKLVERLVPGAKAIGPIGQGFAKPINDLSRGASVEDIVHSALIAAAQAKKDRA